MCIVIETPLYRYWSTSGDHFYTTNGSEIGVTGSGHIVNNGYTSEGMIATSQQVENSMPLYRYWQKYTTDNFYTIHSTEIGTTTLGEVGLHG